MGLDSEDEGEMDEDPSSGEGLVGSEDGVEVC